MKIFYLLVTLALIFPNMAFIGKMNGLHFKGGDIELNLSCPDEEAAKKLCNYRCNGVVVVSWMKDIGLCNIKDMTAADIIKDDKYITTYFQVTFISP